MSGTPLERPRIPLWTKLAALVAGVVVAMHLVRLGIGMSVSSRALAREQAVLGRRIARLLAQDATEPMVVRDLVALNEVVAGATESDESGIVYGLVVQEGRVAASSFASSFAGWTPEQVAAARSPGNRDPIVIVNRGTRVIDIAEPILGGALGEIRIGLTMDVLDDARRELTYKLTLLAVVMTALGFIAAFVMGRRIARPVNEMLATADRFDPAREGQLPSIVCRGSDEIAVLATRLNRMMSRLRTAHVEAEIARQKSLEAQRLAALGSLTAGVAHEVNNPLAGLKNCVRRLERSDLPEPKRREYLAHMHEALERIGDVVQRLLDFGRPRPMLLEAVEIAELAREGVQLANPLLHERRIACGIEEEGEGGLVRADRHEIGYALLNLLLNAAYVTEDGGRIRVRLRRRGGLLGIAVVDEGPGIPAEIRDRILDPFFTTKPVGEGTGLGLSVTRSIVDAHRGELTFEFAEARGTIVTVWLREFASEQDGRVAS